MKIKIGEMTLKNIDYRKLVPLQGELKILKKDNYKRLQKSFKEKGLFVPMFVWGHEGKFKLLDGHGRERLFENEQAVFVDSKGKETYEVPCIVVEAKSLKDAKEKLLIITSQYQTITQEGIDEFGFDLDDSWLADTINFDALNFMKDGPEDLVGGFTDPDEVPEPPKEPIAKKGDLWILGDHRVLCGDSTNNDDVEKLMGGEKADMAYNDPPYGISIVGGGKAFGSVGGDKIVKANSYAPIVGDDTTETAIKAFNLCSNLLIKTMIFWGGNHYSSNLPDSSCWIVWDKDNTGNFADAELAWTNQKSAVRIFKHTWNGLIKESERGEKRVHPTQKPVALAEWCLKQYGAEGDIVLDLFLGSGSTLIASEQTGRKCRGIEISPIYCEIIVKRWEDFTGKKSEKIK